MLVDASGTGAPAAEGRSTDWGGAQPDDQADQAGDDQGAGQSRDEGDHDRTSCCAR